MALHEMPVTLPMYVDSGASAHMLREMRYFSHLWDMVGDEQSISMANGDKLKCKRMGNAVLRSNVNNKRFRLNLYNSYFIPELHCNLISVSKIEETGKKVIFCKGKVEIEDESGQVIATGRKVNGLYALDVSLDDTSSGNCDYANLGKISSNVNIWHKRFAHPRETNMKRLLQHHMVDGLDIKLESEELDPIVCKGCIVASQIISFIYHFTARVIIYIKALDCQHSLVHTQISQQTSFKIYCIHMFS